MTPLGRRKHVRFLLGKPVEGTLRVREEVAIEEWNDQCMVVLSSEPCPVGERVTLEISNGARRVVSGKVAECRPAVVADDAIRHRIRLSIEQRGADVVQTGEGEP